MKSTTPERPPVEQRLLNEGPSPLIAYLLWFFLGSFAAHRFYLGRIGSGFAMLVLFWLGTFTTIILIGWVLLAIYGIWWLLDAFFIRKMIEDDRSAMRLPDRF